MEPLERLLDLVQFLLSRRTPVTFTEIRERIPEAYGQGNLQSAKRMFERDKDVLRDRKSTRLNSSHVKRFRMPSSA